ncbi:MAG: molybdenum cofactor guanylyltransferase [Rhizobiales bacterium]|nr:molybdenum cofactor guanylyltransferase [Hyphomicrobiales bacterium]
MKTLAVIVAGGAALRLGGEIKAFLDIGGRSILDREAEVLRGIADEVVINANEGRGAFEAAGFEVIEDELKTVRTPLAGLHRSLMHAQDKGFDAVLTVPSDTPFLPDDLGERLKQAWKAHAAVAESGDQIHFLTGLWASSLLEALDRAIDRDGLFRVQDWVRLAGAAVVTWPDRPYDPFLNINTPDDLTEARRIAAEFGL